MLLGLIVVITGIALLWVGVKIMRMKQALRWWFERQATLLEQQSQTVHNSLMQDVCAVRRSFELAAVESGLAAPVQDELIHLERIYRSLEQLTDTLSPTYIRESLPLAIQSKVSQWITHHPSLAIELDLPTAWNYEASYQNYLVIDMLDELFRITTLSVPLPSHLKLALNDRSARITLSMEVTYPESDDLRNILGLADVSYLQHTFNILSDGTCSYWKEDKMLCIQFRWRAIQNVASGG